MANATPPVKIQSGALTGIYDKEGDIAIFRSIPYAKPPVGALRWKPPQPAAPWTGTLKAEKVSTRAFQMETDIEDAVVSFVNSSNYHGPNEKPGEAAE